MKINKFKPVKNSEEGNGKSALSSIEEFVSSHKLLIIILFFSVAIVLGVLLNSYSSGISKNLSHYENQELSFSVDYPSKWIVYSYSDEDSRYRGQMFFIWKDKKDVLLRDLLKSAYIMIQVREESQPLENIKKEVEKRSATDENVSFFKGNSVETLKGGNAIEYSLKKQNEEGTYAWRELYFQGEERLYWVSTNRNISSEKYTELREDFDTIFESFKVLK